MESTRYPNNDQGLMESHCRSMMVTNLQTNSQATIQGLNGGRIWASCLSCPKMVVLIKDDWAKNPTTRYSGCYNGFVVTVCGHCARSKRDNAGREGLGRVEVWRETVEGSPSFKTVANFCAVSGLGKLSGVSSMVQDRKALLQDYVEGIIVKSVRLTKMRIWIQ